MRILPTRLDGSAVLLVEGQDDQRVFDALIRARRRTGLQVVVTEGNRDIGRVLRDLTKATGFGKVRWLGIVQDADDDPGAAFRRVRNALARVGLPVRTVTETTPS